jgi:hypothetical protein
MIRLKTFYFLNVTFLVLVLGCSSLEVIPEPNLNQITVKSEPLCLSWNWHPFCVVSKPNSIQLIGVFNNSTLEKKYFLDYYLDSFDTDLPVGVSLKVDGVYYNLRKSATDYVDTLKISSELSEEVVTKLKATKNSISLSYSSRKNTLNFDFSSRQTDKFIQDLTELTNKTTNLQKLKIVK